MTEAKKQVEYYANNESGVMTFLRGLLEHRKFSELYELPEILSFEEELSLPRGRADFVLFHADGSVTVIEAKNGGDTRNVLGGIGQLLSYMIQIGMSAGLKGEVRGMLFAPVEICTPESRLIDAACSRAGVIFAPCVSIKELNGVASKVLGNA